jgi:hypothetical protein
MPATMPTEGRAWRSRSRTAPYLAFIRLPQFVRLLNRGSVDPAVQVLAHRHVKAVVRRQVK